MAAVLSSPLLYCFYYCYRIVVETCRARYVIVRRREEYIIIIIISSL